MTPVVFRIHSPLKLVFFPAMVIALLWVSAPIDFIFSGDAETLLYSSVLVILFGLGLFCGARRWRSKSIIIEVSMQRVRRLVHLLALFGFSGLLLRFYERVILRAGGEITSDFMANRELIASGGSSSLALVAGFFATWLMLLPCAVMLLRKAGDMRMRYRLLAVLSLAYPFFDMVLQGSRSTLVMYAGVVFICFITLNRFRATPRALTLIAVGIVMMPFSLWLMGQVFAMRALQMGLDPILSMTTSGYAHFAPVSDELTRYLSATGMEGGNGFVYAFTHACQYLLHGMYEFFYVLKNIQGAGTEGLLSFYIPIKIFSSLAGGGDVEQRIVDGMIRPGVYTTLWGPMVYDFGKLGALMASLFFGYASGALSKKICSGRLEFFPLYFLVFGFLIFGFVVNLFASGTGQYSIYSSLALYFVLRLSTYRPIASRS